MLLILIINKKKNFFINIIKTFITVTVMEYIIAFISEKFFCKRIWDYTNDFLNINGRVCLKMSIIFTILGLFLVFVVEPIIKIIYIRFSKKTIIFYIIFLLVFTIDVSFTFINK